MLKLRRVAVTGGISCGKSLFCRYLKEFGAYVVSADKIVHQILSPDTGPGKQVIELLGPSIVVNGHIDRGLVAKKVFDNPILLQSLEKILHPAVRKQIDDEYRQASAKGGFTLFVAEVPLLFEAGMEKDFDAVVAVVADEETCIERFKESTGYDAEEYRRRTKRQLSPKAKAERAAIIIYNNSTMEHLRAEAKNLTLKGA